MSSWPPAIRSLDGRLIDANQLVDQDPVIGIEVINPNLDAVSEMKVTAQNYDAEFGKAVAGLVTAQTKSGSNSFHGSLFEFRRSDAQQARDPFAESTPHLRRHLPRLRLRSRILGNRPLRHQAVFHSRGYVDTIPRRRI